MVLEVGLGGRLDAVNIVDPSVAVITSIDLDHQGWLGESRGEIAREKAGILRRDTPVVVADPEPPVELLHCITKVGARPALFLGKEFTLTRSEQEWQAVVRGSDGQPRHLASARRDSMLPENICAAVQAAIVLGVAVSDEAIAQAIANAAPVGRRQLRHVAGRDYVLDVAHNPAAVHKLREYLSALPCAGRTIGLFSAMSDKDLDSMISAAGECCDAWFVADQPDNPRAAKASDIAAALTAAGHTMISISKNLRQAFRRAQRIASGGDRLVIFGSFTTVAAVLPLLDAIRESGAAPERVSRGEG